MTEDDRMGRLWVTVDDFVAEPVRWFLDVIVDHATIAITRDGTPVAYLIGVELATSAPPRDVTDEGTKL